MLSGASKKLLLKNLGTHAAFNFQKIVTLVFFVHVLGGVY